MRAKVIDYDADEKNTGGTETHMATDVLINKRNQLQDMIGDVSEDVSLENAYEEGFSSASGVRGETAETGGRIKHPETQDKARPNGEPDAPEGENSGLADN